MVVVMVEEHLALKAAPVVLVVGRGLILHPEGRVILLLHHQAKVIMEVMVLRLLVVVAVLVALDLLALELLLVLEEMVKRLYYLEHR
jgi:hypothetical protein